MMLTISMYFYHGPFPADPGHGPGGGQPFANFTKAQICMSRGESEVERHTQGHLVGEAGGGIEPRHPDGSSPLRVPFESQPCTALPLNPPLPAGTVARYSCPVWVTAIPRSSLPGLHTGPNLLLLQGAPPSLQPLKTFS